MIRGFLKRVPGLRAVVVHARTVRDRLRRKLFDRLSERSVSRMLALRGCLEGRRCWVIGNGPSLTSLDLSLLRDEITIGCNSIWLLYDKLDWRPTFHTVEDAFVAEDSADTISSLTGSIKVYPRDLSYCIRGDRNTIWVNFQRGHYPGFPKFSESCHEIMYWGGTVTCMNLQLAHWLGCNPIYLIGLDMNYKVPDYREGTRIVSREADVNHFHPDYFGPGKRWHDPNVERMQRCLDHALKFLQSRGVKACNATRGGKLERFPRVKYEEVLAEPDPNAPSPAELAEAPPGSRRWWAQVERRSRLRSSEPPVELPRVERPHKDWRAHATMALKGIRPTPLSVQIQTTSHCNGQCVICPYPESWHKQNPGRMDDALFDRIVAQLKLRPLKRLCLYLENEPFLDAAMLGRLRRVSHELRFECLNIGTNAAPLTPDKARELAEICRNVPHELWLSFHGTDEESYRRVMGLDFARSLRNVTELLKLSDEYGLTTCIRSATRPIAAVAAGEAPVNFSAEAVQQFWAGVCREHGIRRKPRIDTFAYHDRAGAIRRNTCNFGARRNSLAGLYCDRLDEWLHVLYNGDAILCCNDYHRETVIGNLNDMGLDDLLTCERYREYRLMAMGLEPAPADFICRRCFKPGG